MGWVGRGAVIVPYLRRVRLLAAPWTKAARLPILHLLERAETCPSGRWCHPTISSSVVPLLLLPSVFSSLRDFSESGFPIRWPKYWSFSFSLTPSNEHSGLISFRIDWFDLRAVQGTLKTLLQHHNPKAPVLLCWAFLMDQLSHPYLTTGRTIALIIQIFVGKVMSLLFNTLSRFVTAFLPRSVPYNTDQKSVL